MLTPQAGAILTHLKRGHHITPLEAIGVFGVFRLAARIFEIRRSGYLIDMAVVTDARGKRYARYTLVTPDGYTPGGVPFYHMSAVLRDGAWVGTRGWANAS